MIPFHVTLDFLILVHLVQYLQFGLGIIGRRIPRCKRGVRAGEKGIFFWFRTVGLSEVSPCFAHQYSGMVPFHKSSSDQEMITKASLLAMLIEEFVTTLCTNCVHQYFHVHDSQFFFPTSANRSFIFFIFF